MFDLSQILIKKKDGTLEEYQWEKIVNAIKKSSERTDEPFDEIDVKSEREIEKILGIIEEKLIMRDDNVIDIIQMHSLVENSLQQVRPDVAESYRNYRNWKREVQEDMEKVYEECQSIMFLGDKSNANADSTLVSTKRVKKLEVLEKSQYRRYFLTRAEKQALHDGYIYGHDMGARLDTLNCCLFDMENVLKGGFEMSNVWYNEPKSLETAFPVIGDITLMSASQQYGGFTIPEIDEILEPYAEKSFKMHYEKSLKKAMKNLETAIKVLKESGAVFDEVLLRKEMTKRAEAVAEKEAYDLVERAFMQGFQGWEYKFNTVASSRGDYPFITVTFGVKNTRWGNLASKCILRVRKGGQGKEGKKKPVLFPKLVFLYDEKIHGKGKECEDVFEEAIMCSSKTMYPDYLSLSGEGYIADMYKKYGLVISPMGCRAFLSPWYLRGGMNPMDENDVPVFKGRFNIGVFSLNLPMILAKSQREGKDFYKVLDYYLEMIRGLHVRTKAYLGQMKASMNPLGFCEGGFLNGNLDYNDKIAPVLESATASFGITALNELSYLHNGKSIVEDGKFALEVMQYINDFLNRIKKEDGLLYAVYGTPAESLCGLQVKQFRKQYGIIPNVSDRSYVSNSFHCHVSEDISPSAKQDLEGRFWGLFNGGKIQYVRYKNATNLEAFRVLIRRAMDKGFYEGANLSLAYCNECGHEETDMGDTCPICGSRDLTKIDRMNGYLAYSRVRGETRLGDAKMDEISDRKSM